MNQNTNNNSKYHHMKDSIKEVMAGIKDVAPLFQCCYVLRSRISKYILAQALASDRA